MARFTFLPITFDMAQPPAIINDWNIIYTVPVGKMALLFAGHITNVDSGTQATHFASLGANAELNSNGNKYLLANVPVPYGSSLNPGKALFGAGEEIGVWAETPYLVFNLYFILQTV